MPKCSTPYSATHRKTPSPPGPRNRTRSDAEPLVVQEKYAKAGKLGPVARLLPTTAATTLRKVKGEPLVHRRPLRRNQGAAARLLHDRVPTVSTKPSASLANCPTPTRAAAPTKSAPSACFSPGRPNHMTDIAWINPLLTSASPQAVAALLRYFRDLDTAEEAFQEACLRALKNWPRERAAARPDRLADLRRAQHRDRRGAPQVEARSAARRAGAVRSRRMPKTAIAERLDGADYRDDILRLLFICCHPDLPATQQIALALRIVSGLSVKQIARAFLVGESAMEQRITRAKARIAARPRCPSRRRAPVERSERLAAVAAMVYLVFNEGYSASGGDVSHARAALRRGDPAGAAAAPPVPDRARDHGADGADASPACAQPVRASTQDGAVVLLEDQDRGKWNGQDDRRGAGADRQGDAPPPARPLPDPGGDRRPARPRQAAGGHGLAADRPALPARWRRSSPRRSSRSTAPSPSRSRADPQAALDMIEPLAPKLSGYFHFFGVKGGLLMQLGRHGEARAAFDQRHLARQHGRRGRPYPHASRPAGRTAQPASQGFASRLPDTFLKKIQNSATPCRNGAVDSS